MKGQTRVVRINSGPPHTRPESPVPVALSAFPPTTMWVWAVEDATHSFGNSNWASWR